jgi:hypothetical protein
MPTREAQQPGILVQAIFVKASADFDVVLIGLAPFGGAMGGLAITGIEGDSLWPPRIRRKKPCPNQTINRAQRWALQYSSFSSVSKRKL